MKAVHLQTEYLENPVGIDIAHPRLFWQCEGGMRQTAYRLFATSGGTVVWDSGKVASSSMRAEFPAELSSRQRVEWKVKLWDEEDCEGEWSETAFFEMGLLVPSDFKAKWIAGNYTPKRGERYPVDCFKKQFSAIGVRRARLYVSACGLYEVRLNGERVGDFIFAPGSTDYRKRVQYQTYDVTALIRGGINEMTAELADGWYRGSNGSKGRVNTYGKETALFVQLELFDGAGQVTRIMSDKSWAWSDDGPITFADLRDGEHVDARKRPSYRGRAKELDRKVNLTASDNVFVKEQERFKPEEVTVSPSGKRILKFPQNLSGYLCFRLTAREGQRLRIRLGEMVKGGELSQDNIQNTYKGKKTPLQEIEYICHAGVNDYTPKFCFAGFEYAEVETDIPFEKDDFTAVAVYSAFEETSAFSCSHPLINALYRCTLWSLKSNSTDVPTDCPTRERMGWTGDSEIFFNTAAFMADYAAFARKHVRDIFDRKFKNGKLPQIAPWANEDFIIYGLNGSVGWADAGVYIPYYLYKRYGDERILEDYYDDMLDYADFMCRRAGKWGGVYSKPVFISLKNQRYLVNCGRAYGEWAEPSDVKPIKWYDFMTPKPEEATAYTYFTLTRVLEIADILKKPKTKRLKRLEKYRDGAKRAYRELVEKKGYSLDTDRQAKLVRPLYMGLLTKEQEEYAKKRLIKALDNYGWRLSTGFLSTPLILFVLEDIGIEYAYRLLENEKRPGWLFMPKNGATTIWEAWEGNADDGTAQGGIASLNHYSKGAVCEWLMSRMCGINVAGENRFVLSPKPGGTLTYARAEYKSIYGTVSCGWEKDGASVRYHITVPSNTSADVVLPDGREMTLSAGQYTL